MSVLLILMPTIELGEARIAIIVASSTVFGVGELATPGASRRRHFGFGSWHAPVQLFGYVTNTVAGSS
jgi:hypothetical protein